MMRKVSERFNRFGTSHVFREFFGKIEKFSGEPLPSVLGKQHSQVGSLAGAAHLLNDNAGVLRAAHREQKSRVESKVKSCFDFCDFQYEYKP